MTTFIDVPTLSRMVERVGLTRFMAGMTDYVSEDFERWAEFEKCARVASHSDIGVIELMPVSDGERYGFKYVNGHPANTTKGLSTVMAFGALADVETGFPNLVAELTITTALRTAATASMATRALARPEARRLAMIGAGAQSEFQAIALHTQCGIEELVVYDVDRNAMAKLIRHLRAYPELKVRKADSVAAAVLGADVVTTCTADKRWATILTPDMIAPGMHINGLGGDCPGKTELHGDVLRGADIFVEYEPQTRIEGDIQQLPAAHPVTELWRVLTGVAAGRADDASVTVFDSVGFALEDFSALRYLHTLALDLGMGEQIDLIPELDDPKDLFACVAGATRARAVA